MSKFERFLVIVLALVLALGSVVGIVGCLAPESEPPQEFTQQALGPRPHVPYLTHLYTEVDTDTWFILIDLSDKTNYPHANINGIILKSLQYAGDLSAAKRWDWDVGIVTAIAADTTNIEWVTSGTHIEASQFDSRWWLPEHGLNLGVVGGVLPFVGTIVSETNAITSSTTLSGSAYITAVVAVGDLVLYLDEVENDATLYFTMDTAYDTE